MKERNLFNFLVTTKKQCMELMFLKLKAAPASQQAIIALLFLQFKEFELYWGAVLKICSHIFMIFEVKL